MTAWRFIGYVARGRYRNWLLVLATGEALNAACGITLPYALSRIISNVTNSKNPSAPVMQALWAPLTLFVALCAGELVFGRVNAAIHMRMAPRQRQYVSRSLFHYLHRHSHRYLTENFAGALAHRISETSHGVNNVLWALITELWPITIVIAVANALLLSASPWLGLFSGLWSVGFIAVSLAMSRRTQPLAFAASNARSHTVGMVVDSVSNHATVRSFARLDHERVRLDDAYGSELTTVLRANLAMEHVRLFQFAASAVLKAGTVAVSVWLWSRGRIGVSEFVLAISLALLIIAEVRNLSRRFLELFESLGNVGSGVRAIFQPHELPDHPDARACELESGTIELHEVDFRYPQGAQVFRGLSLSIPAGQRVGLVGLSGSGKSTFVSMIMRLYDAQSGSIRIGGHELCALTQDALHRQIGLIPQDPTLFHRSLRENIRYGRIEATDVEVEEAARRARAHEFIREIPEGYEAMVGERGVKLSGGQRQRIAIARVMLKNAPVLILDEATSSLDSITEQEIQAALDDAMVGKTVIVIAHRLSTIAHLDRILVFSNGEIVEDGSHAELAASRGAYYELWSRQSSGLLPGSDADALDIAAAEES
ncbi:MAG TPA: ABC transporter ATP-binding protein [Polyangiales bacterium]|nr:ABC transporter ATP-binding protein [Polyangiales bacterium]